MFIYKNLMSSISADSKLKQKTFDILDRLTYKYKERVKFLFWCQYGRQMINIRAGKYIDPNTGVYNHVFNYEELKERYRKNIVDIPRVKDYFSLIESDNSVHPTIDGYRFLDLLIKNNL